MTVRRVWLACGHVAVVASHVQPGARVRCSSCGAEKELVAPMTGGK